MWFNVIQQQQKIMSFLYLLDPRSSDIRWKKREKNTLKKSSKWNENETTRYIHKKTTRRNKNDINTKACMNSKITLDQEKTKHKTCEIATLIHTHKDQ